MHVSSQCSYLYLFVAKYFNLLLYFNYLFVAKYAHGFVHVVMYKMCHTSNLVCPPYWISFPLVCGGGHTTNKVDVISYDLQALVV